MLTSLSTYVMLLRDSVTCSHTKSHYCSEPAASTDNSGGILLFILIKYANSGYYDSQVSEFYEF